MPLPDKADSPWPPVWLKPVHHKVDEWSEWYRGDPVKLAKLYTLRNSQTENPATFWGTPIPDGERSTKLHVPLARDIATTSSRLLYSEPPTLTVKDTKAQARLNELVDDGVHTTLLAAAEVTAAKGGSYLRIVWDKAILGRPWIARVDPRAAVPVFRWDRLVALTVWRILYRDNSRVVRYLEQHEPGSIQHAVYDGTTDQIGRRIDLSTYPDTAWLVSADGITITGNVATVETGVDGRLTAVYVPNITPSPIWDDVPGAASLGRSDYDGVEPLLGALDGTWTSLMRELRLGVARLMVPSSYIRSAGPGKGGTFDAAQELFTKLETMEEGERGLNIELIQPAIRVDEHLRIAAQQTRTIVESAGYSAQSFGLDGGAAATATEVVARERESFIGRDAKVLHQRPALAELLETLQMVDAVVFNTGITPEPVDVEFGDSVSQDPESVARTLQALAAADAISTWMKVRVQHPDWDDADVQEEVDRILAESGQQVEDPGTFTGAPPQELPGQVGDPEPPA